MDWLFLTAGIALGLIIGLLYERTRSRGEMEKLRARDDARDDQAEWIENAQQHLRETFKALASDSLHRNSDEFRKQSSEKFGELLSHVEKGWETRVAHFKNMVDPLKEHVGTLEKHVAQLEAKRENAYGQLEKQLNTLSESHRDLMQTSTKLAQAMQSTGARGKWGELELERILEAAGLTEGIHYERQSSGKQGRPDATIKLPNGGFLPVDSKVPMNAYMEALDATDPAERERKLLEHARNVKDRIKELAKAEYWNQFGDKAPELVIMFVPVESSLSAAFQADSTLFDFALEKKVMPTTPVNLLALLRTVAFGWQQQQLTDNAMEIAEEGRELYKRLGTFVKAFATVGGRLNKTVEDYNKAVGSLQQRLMPSARKLRDRGSFPEEIPEPTTLEKSATEPFLKELEVEPRDDRIVDLRNEASK